VDCTDSGSHRRICQRCVASASRTRRSPHVTIADRGIGRVVTTAPPEPGFIGEGHTAVAVVDGKEFEQNDPFIALMDDRIDLEPGREAGGAHPHGGVRDGDFVVEGKLRDRDEGMLETGDVLWMTAGSGVIHNENVVPQGKSRILQLWLTASAECALDGAPIRAPSRAMLRPCDTSPAWRRAFTVAAPDPSQRRPTNYVPVTLIDLRLHPHARFEQQLPDSYNGFLYVLGGDVFVGRSGTRLAAGQVGWLAEPERGMSNVAPVHITAGREGARVVLYAGQRQGVPIVQHWSVRR